MIIPRFSFLSNWRIYFVFLLLYYPLAGPGSLAQVTGYKPDELQAIDVKEQLGNSIPLTLQFVNETGDTVLLKDYFDGERPTILILAYYRCPMLCSLVLNGFTEGARQLKFQPGKDYRMVTISIDPAETPELALQKKQNYVNSWGDSVVADAWSFLTGDEKSIKTLAAATGFTYYYDEEQNQYAHPAVLHILTGEGIISRYLYGIEFKTQDLRLGLLEAAQGKIGNTMDRLLLYCYHYDPNSKGYALFAANVMKIGGLITLILLSTLIFVLWAKYRAQKA